MSVSGGCHCDLCCQTPLVAGSAMTDLPLAALRHCSDGKLWQTVRHQPGDPLSSGHCSNDKCTLDMFLAKMMNWQQTTALQNLGRYVVNMKNNIILRGFRRFINHHKILLIIIMLPSFCREHQELFSLFSYSLILYSFYRSPPQRSK